MCVGMRSAAWNWYCLCEITFFVSFPGWNNCSYTLSIGLRLILFYPGWLLKNLNRAKRLSFFTWFNDIATLILVYCISESNARSVLKKFEKLSFPDFFKMLCSRKGEMIFPNPFPFSRKAEYFGLICRKKLFNDLPSKVIWHFKNSFKRAERVYFYVVSALKRQKMFSA